MSHFYELANLGPFTVGGVVVRIMWPLEDGDGNSVSRLEQTPFVRYTGPTGDYEDECQVENAPVDKTNLVIATLVKC